MAKKILIIEDEPAIAQSLFLALQSSYEVTIAQTGKAGLEKAKSEKPDLVLLDIMLPDITGFEVLKKLKADKETEDIEVIVSTNLTDADTVSKILAAGGKEYIVKTDWKVKDIVKKIDQTFQKE